MTNGRSPEKARITFEQKNNSDTTAELANNAFDIMAIKLFLKSSMDVNVKNNEGVTALKFAKELGRSEVVELLRAVGASQ